MSRAIPRALTGAIRRLPIGAGLMALLIVTEGAIGREGLTASLSYDDRQVLDALVSGVPRARSVSGLAEVSAALGVISPRSGDAPSGGVGLSVPDVVENGALVPVALSVSGLGAGSDVGPGTDVLVILVEPNPYPFGAAFVVPEGTDPAVSLRVKMAGSGMIHAVARRAGRFAAGSADVRVAVGGCSSSPGSDGSRGVGASAGLATTSGGDPGEAGPEPIRIRASRDDEMTEVVLLMRHPMHTGLDLDATGRPPPAHYIEDVDVRLGTRSLLRAFLGIAVARDPLIRFRFAGGRPGDRIQVTWTDNRGATRTDSATLL